ncbi:MAG: hypothetical protein MJD61_21625 [Proteobacteria bacterium]|nr:hypothetical protein [Pseudomonadota bacterium]
MIGLLSGQFVAPTGAEAAARAGANPLPRALQSRDLAARVEQPLEADRSKEEDGRRADERRLEDTRQPRTMRGGHAGRAATARGYSEPAQSPSLGDGEFPPATKEMQRRLAAANAELAATQHRFAQQRQQRVERRLEQEAHREAVRERIEESSERLLAGQGRIDGAQETLSARARDASGFAAPGPGPQEAVERKRNERAALAAERVAEAAAIVAERAAEAVDDAADSGGPLPDRASPNPPAFPPDADVYPVQGGVQRGFEAYRAQTPQRASTPPERPPGARSGIDLLA